MSNKGIEPLINYISSFFSVGEKDIDLFFKAFKHSFFPKGSVLEKESSLVQKLYFINTGFIRTFSDEDGEEITTRLSGKGTFVTSFNSFISGDNSRETIKCVSDCELLYITKSTYKELTNESVIWTSFCKQVYEREIEFNLQRNRDFLALTAKERYLKLFAEQPEIVQHIPIQYIASYIGIKPESLSRIRRKVLS
jgi:CRP/FNR family transcriptional regulator, anaerobic regulatory protein